MKLTREEREGLYQSVAGDLDTLNGLLGYIEDQMTVLGARDRRIGQVRNRLYGVRHQLHVRYVRETGTSLQSPFYRLTRERSE